MVVNLRRFLGLSVIFMNAFRDACEVEARSMAELMPYLESKALNGRVVLTAKGTLSKELQACYGDLFLNDENERIWAVEVKAEETARYGNLFLEEWSNRSCFTLGWLYKLSNETVLLYYFLDTKELYGCTMQSLKHWAFIYPNRLGTQGAIWEYQCKEQRKRNQLNDTWGRCVPVERLLRDNVIKALDVKERKASQELVEVSF